MTFPRGRHEFPLLLGIYFQVIRLGSLRSPHDARELAARPLIVLGRGTNVSDRLRELSISSSRLCDALRVHRVRYDGTVVDLRGQRVTAGALGHALVCLNTRVGLPTIGTPVGTVIVDRAGLSEDAFSRVLAWADSHLAERIVVIGDLGHAPPPAQPGYPAWQHWPWTPELIGDVRDTLGTRPSGSALSTNALLLAPPPRIGVATYRADHLTAHRLAALRALSAARKVSSEAFPSPVSDAARLFSLLEGVWGPVRLQDECAVASGQGVTAAGLARLVASRDLRSETGPWAVYRDAWWPELRRGVLGYHGLLVEENPKWDLLLGLVDWASHARSGGVVIRVRSRAAQAAVVDGLAAALDMSPRDLHKDGGRLTVRTYAERLSWSTGPGVALHASVPTGGRLSSLFSGECAEQLVVVTPEEEPRLSSVVEPARLRWARDTTPVTQDLGVEPPTVDVRRRPTLRAYGPVDLSRRDEIQEPRSLSHDSTLSALFADLDEVVERARKTKWADSERRVRARGILIEPDGALVWLPADRPVEVVVGRRFAAVSVDDLAPGTRFLLDRGKAKSGYSPGWSRLLTAQPTLPSSMRCCGSSEPRWLRSTPSTHPGRRC